MSSTTFEEYYKMIIKKHIEMFEKYYKKPFEEITETDIVNRFSKVTMNPAELEEYVERRLKEHTMKLTERVLEYYPFLYSCFRNNIGIAEPMELSKEEMDTVIEKIYIKHEYKKACRRGSILGHCQEMYREINLFRADEHKNADILLILFDENEEMMKEWMPNLEKHFILELMAVGFDKWKIMSELNMTEEVYEANAPSQEEIDEYEPAFTADEPTDEEVEDAYNEYLIEEEKLNNPW